MPYAIYHIQYHYIIHFTLYSIHYTLHYRHTYKYRICAFMIYSSRLLIMQVRKSLWPRNKWWPDWSCPLSTTGERVSATWVLVKYAPILTRKISSGQSRRGGFLITRNLMYPDINMENASQKNMVDSCPYHMKWHRISRSFPALFGFERTDPGGRNRVGGPTVPCGRSRLGH